MGAIDGVAIGQMVGGQIGAMSNEPLHSGCMLPLTHRQRQSALAIAIVKMNNPKIAVASLMTVLPGAQPRA